MYIQYSCNEQSFFHSKIKTKIKTANNANISVQARLALKKSFFYITSCIREAEKKLFSNGAVPLRPYLKGPPPTFEANSSRNFFNK